MTACGRRNPFEKSFSRKEKIRKCSIAVKRPRCKGHLHTPSLNSHPTLRNLSLHYYHSNPSSRQLSFIRTLPQLDPRDYLSIGTIPHLESLKFFTTVWIWLSWRTTAAFAVWSFAAVSSLRATYPRWRHAPSCNI